ncbi:hypothetical protein Sjap_020693 [Stephania japonica]|uniref:Zinc knuckle CX2CX4HX4C domain-containing protein n=1 Tax=Stephania japonica TaxID=461633 RepID=A0AAP0I0V7_9MAGN
MDEHFDNLVLSDEENEEIVLEPVGNQLQNKLASIWNPIKGLSVVECPTNRFIFQFYRHIDMGKELKDGDIPRQVCLDNVLICVQAYDVPVGFMYVAVGRQLGDFIGKFVEYDSVNNFGRWKEYMRIKVAMPVQLPLKRGKMLKISADSSAKVSFKYEKIPTFCCLCGLLGHNENYWPIVFEVDDADKLPRKWGIWLRAPLKGQDRSGEKWLRRGIDDERWPVKEGPRSTTVNDEIQAMITDDNIGVKSTEVVTTTIFQNSVIVGAE